MPLQLFERFSVIHSCFCCVQIMAVTIRWYHYLLPLTLVSEEVTVYIREFVNTDTKVSDYASEDSWCDAGVFVR